MDQFRRQRVIRGLCDINMVEMKPTGHWGLTPDGRDFIDQLEVMRELDDRPGAPAGTEQTRAVTPAGGARRGDDVPTARGAPRQGTR